MLCMFVHGQCRGAISARVQQFCMCRVLTQVVMQGRVEHKQNTWLHLGGYVPHTTRDCQMSPPCHHGAIFVIAHHRHSSLKASALHGQISSVFVLTQKNRLR